MSDMHFREPNQVKWQGSRPGHNGTQVIIKINTDAAAELYEVTAGKTFFLTAFSLGVVRNVNGFQILAIRDDLDAYFCYLGFVNSFTDDPGLSCGLALTYPLEIPSGYDFYVSSATDSRGFIAGWEE